MGKIEVALGDVAAPPSPENFDAVLEAIVSERGGASAFSPSQIAAARRLARMLVEETVRLDAPGVGVLLEMLPPKSAPAQFDLAKLDCDELCQLARIIAKLNGVPWEEPTSRPDGGHPYHRPDGPGGLGGLGGCMCAACMPRDAEGNVIAKAKAGAADAT
jgi:hypothetical protein